LTGTASIYFTTSLLILATAQKLTDIGIHNLEDHVIITLPKKISQKIHMLDC